MKRSLIALALLVVFGLVLRPPVPLDETRYLAVAWEMHLAQAWLVPSLDGLPYHHKPPLLFWLTRAGWEVFGVHAWWPRVLPGIAALLCLCACRALARRIALADGADAERAKRVGDTALLLLAASFAWSIYSSVLLFDLLVAAWALLGLHALLDRQQRPLRSALLLALAVGGGCLSKGPVILVYLLPAALLLPLAQPPAKAARLRGIVITLLGVAGGALIALAWALPAAQAGGEVYARALLFGQTAGRLQDSFSHARPFWWYLPIGFVLLLPWSCLPPWWKSWSGAGTHAKALLYATLCSFLCFTLISGKQPHYLVPLLPALFAATACRLPRLGRYRKAAWATPAVTGILLLSAWLWKSPAFDLRPAAERVHAAQLAEKPTAFLGDSHGQLSLLGRLEQAPQRIYPSTARDWAYAHPSGLAVLIRGAATRSGLWTPKILEQAEYRSPYRNEELAIVPAFAIYGEPPNFTPAIEQARKLLQEELAKGVGPGISVAIAYRGQVVWAEGFGWAHIAKEQPVTSKTLFRIGSVSKPLTAAGLMLLVESGQLDLDADVRSYVPEFPKKKWPVTTRQLAGHLGGIRHYRGGEFLSRKHYPTVRDGLAIFADDPLIAEPGSRHSYSSYGYNLLSAAMESAAEQPFLEFMQAKVFDPLQLKQTMPDHANQEIAERTAFYQTVAGKFLPAVPVDNSYKWAGGGFLSTPSDLVRFQFGVQNPDFLSSASRREMFASQKTQDGQDIGYGIGWRIGNHKLYGKTVAHSGGSVGGSTMLSSYLGAHLVVAITINNADQPAGRLAREVAAPFLAIAASKDSADSADD